MSSILKFLFKEEEIIGNNITYLIHHFLYINNERYSHVEYTQSTHNGIEQKPNISGSELCFIKNNTDEEYFFATVYNSEFDKLDLITTGENLVQTEEEIHDYIYKFYLEQNGKKLYPKFEKFTIIKLNYTKEDLEPVTLNDSEQIISSPLLQFDSMLEEEFIFIDTLRHDKETCVIHNSNNKRDYLIHISFIKKK